MTNRAVAIPLVLLLAACGDTSLDTAISTEATTTTTAATTTVEAITTTTEAATTTQTPQVSAWR